jgi:beta-lactamase family protein
MAGSKPGEISAPGFYCGFDRLLFLCGDRKCLGAGPCQSSGGRYLCRLDKPGSPGCALDVYRNGKIIFANRYGLANIEDGIPISPQTVFDVGSLAKQFTAASILLLDGPRSWRTETTLLPQEAAG